METTVFTEILPNIQSTNINFGIPVINTNKLKSIYKLEIKTSDSPSITTSLDSLDIKLKLRSYVRKKLSRESSLLSSSNKLPFSATEITINNFINILCGKHWIELLDCWMCHQEEYPQAQFIMNDIIVKENICLIGNTYYLIFPTNWTKGLSRKWRSMSCSRCLKPLGEGLYSMEDKTEGGKEIIIAADFLEAAKAHATYRFIIEGQKMNKPYILIITNALQDIKSQNKFSPDVIMTLHDLLVKENEMKINDDKTVEHFKYHDDICLQLLVTLKTSMNSLPFSKRVMMNDFNIERELQHEAIFQEKPSISQNTATCRKRKNELVPSELKLSVYFYGSYPQSTTGTISNSSEKFRSIYEVEHVPGEAKKFLERMRNDFSHKDEWVLMYKQNIQGYKKEVTNEEDSDLLDEMKGALYLPVDHGLRKLNQQERCTLNHYVFIDSDSGREYTSTIDTAASETILPYNFYKNIGKKGWSIIHRFASDYGSPSCLFYTKDPFDVSIGNDVE
ncbi:5517_t:CDS:10 [Diversispora eburnea]|uniref:5517_t:CDS:1 n=1 Tax=Diversispora eburnea TaxID=1213867 RepID=A0A9N9AJC9_9GLOM|nr:5517_t:CDS:10 [Diversispora eburnea]